MWTSVKVYAIHFAITVIQRWAHVHLQVEENGFKMTQYLHSYETRTTSINSHKRVFCTSIQSWRWIQAVLTLNWDIQLNYYWDMRNIHASFAHCLLKYVVCLFKGMAIDLRELLFMCVVWCMGCFEGLQWQKVWQTDQLYNTECAISNK